MCIYPNSKVLSCCLDGIGAEIKDATERSPKSKKDSSTRQYTVRYIIPTVSSPHNMRDMRVSGDSAEEAVKAVMAAHPNADITSVD